MIVYGYYAHKVLEQGDKVLKRDYEKYKEHFLKTTRKNLIIMEDAIKEWQAFANQLLTEMPNPESSKSNG